MTDPTTDRSALREQLLDALDFSYCQGLGFETPETLLAAYDAASAMSLPPADQTALRDRIAEALIAWTYRGKEPDPEVGILDTVRANAYSRADAVLAVLPATTGQTADRADILREAINAVRDGDLGPRDGMSRDYENGWWNSRAAAEQRIRSLADADQESAPTTDQQVRAVQAWMALDLHQALGRPVDHSATMDHQGHASWADWWADLLAGVRNAQMIRDYRVPLRRMADETSAAETQAHEPLHQWRVEILDGDEWMPASGLRRDRAQAVDQLQMSSAKRPLWNDGTKVQRRLVRETTTCTVEQSVVGARQDGAQR